MRREGVRRCLGTEASQGDLGGKGEISVFEKVLGNVGTKRSNQIISRGKRRKKGDI